MSKSFILFAFILLIPFNALCQIKSTNETIEMADKREIERVINFVRKVSINMDSVVTSIIKDQNIVYNENLENDYKKSIKLLRDLSTSKDNLVNACSYLTEIKTKLTQLEGAFKELAQENRFGISDSKVERFTKINSQLLEVLNRFDQCINEAYSRSIAMDNSKNQIEQLSSVNENQKQLQLRLDFHTHQNNKNIVQNDSIITILNEQNEFKIHSFLVLGFSTTSTISAGVYSTFPMSKKRKISFIEGAVGVQGLVNNSSLDGVRVSFLPLSWYWKKNSRYPFNGIGILVGPSYDFFITNEFVENLGVDVLVQRNSIGLGYHWSVNSGHGLQILFGFN